MACGKISWLTQTLTTSIYLFTPLLLQTHPKTNITWQRSSWRRTQRDAYHYSASFKYSNSIRGDTKGLIRADELHSWVLFFLLLLIAAISGCVGETVPDNSPLKQAHLPHLCSGRWCSSEVSQQNAIGKYAHGYWMLNVVHHMTDCHRH